jgi:hypothetical protein
MFSFEIHTEKEIKNSLPQRNYAFADFVLLCIFKKGMCAFENSFQQIKSICVPKVWIQYKGIKIKASSPRSVAL